MSGRVLITGGAGFIGLHLAQRLADLGYTIDLHDNFSRGADDAELRDLLEHGQVSLVIGDLLRPDGLAGVRGAFDYAVHLAARVGVRNVVADPERTLIDNVTMLHHILRWARDQTALRRFLFFSTSEVYAGAEAAGLLPIPTPEDAPLVLPSLSEARSAYALSKIVGESLCHYAGVPYTILRPHNVYGPRMGMDHVIPELLRRAYDAPDGGELSVYSVEHRRTFCFVADAVELIRLALEAPGAAGRTLNLGAGAPEVTIGHLATLVAQVVGKELTIVPLPPTPGSPSRRQPDMSLAAAVTGFRAQVDLEEGVTRTFDWYREHLFEHADAGPQP